MIKVYAFVGAVVVSFGAGWQSRSWYEDSKDLVEIEATQAMEDKFAKVVADISASVETKLEGLQANERIIERWRTKIVDRPVYHVDCIDDDGLRLIKAYATGEPAELTGEVSNKAASADR